MAVKWRIRQLMADKEEKTGIRETYNKINAATHISPNTLSALATGKSQLIGVSTIERLLKYFDCEPNDLIRVVE